MAGLQELRVRQRGALQQCQHIQKALVTQVMGNPVGLCDKGEQSAWRLITHGDSKTCMLAWQGFWPLT